MEGGAHWKEVPTVAIEACRWALGCGAAADTRRRRRRVRAWREVAGWCSCIRNKGIRMRLALCFVVLFDTG